MRFFEPCDSKTALQNKANLIMEKHYTLCGVSPHLLLVPMAIGLMSLSNPVSAPQEYFKKYSHWAVSEMKKSGIPASIILAQAAVESSWGNSELAKNANNHFGIKSIRDWDGATFCKTDDDRDARGRLIKSCFRQYKSVQESYIDHTQFIVEDDRYDDLFYLAPTDYKSWARGLRDKNYASRADYDRLLIEKIEQYELYRYDEALQKQESTTFVPTTELVLQEKDGESIAPAPVEIPDGYERGSLRVEQVKSEAKPQQPEATVRKKRKK